MEGIIMEGGDDQGMESLKDVFVCPAHVLATQTLVVCRGTVVHKVDRGHRGVLACMLLLMVCHVGQTKVRWFLSVVCKVKKMRWHHCRGN